MQITPFLAHYQSVYTNFYFSSFSRISCFAKALLLVCKSIPFTLQKHWDCNTKALLLQHNASAYRFQPLTFSFSTRGKFDVKVRQKLSKAILFYSYFTSLSLLTPSFFRRESTTQTAKISLFSTLIPFLFPLNNNLFLSHKRTCNQQKARRKEHKSCSLSAFIHRKYE